MSVLQNLPIIVDDPVHQCARPKPDISSSIERPDRPSSIVAPILRTTIPLKRDGDVGQ
jgi:hypothetical protein